MSSRHIIIFDIDIWYRIKYWYQSLLESHNLILILQHPCCFQCEHRVPGPDEEGGEEPPGDGRPQHPQLPAPARATRRPTRQDTEGTRRVPREGESIFPKVRD